MISLLSAILTLAHLGLPLTPPADAEPLFSDYFAAAEIALEEMTPDEKIAQVLLVRFPGDEEGIAAEQKHQFGGYIFFSKDFATKDSTSVRNLMARLQSVSKIPLLTAVDEEGGTVTRVSQNPLLSPSRFASPQSLYRTGGFAAIRDDTLAKSHLLADLGLNLNLAPVVDVSENPRDFMFSRSLGEDTALTAEFARTVISTSLGSGVTFTLKHFPGYGNNRDTHFSSTTDTRTLASILEHDLPPFRAGIDAGAEAILISHNVISALDPDHPASLSPAVHDFLRTGLGFSGIVITDDLAMGAVADLPHPTLDALLAGNDLIITSDYETSLAELRTALAAGTLPESTLDLHVQKILAWKLSKNH